MRLKRILAALLVMTMFLTLSVSANRATPGSGQVITVAGTTQLFAIDADLFESSYTLDDPAAHDYLIFNPNPEALDGQVLGFLEHFRAGCTATWNLNVTVPGTYRITMNHSKNPANFHFPIDITVGGGAPIRQFVVPTAGPTGGWGYYIDLDFGTVTLPAGTTTLVVAGGPREEAANIVNPGGEPAGPNQRWMRLTYVTLELVEAAAPAAPAPPAPPAPGAAPQAPAAQQQAPRAPQTFDPIALIAAAALLSAAGLMIARKRKALDRD